MTNEELFLIGDLDSLYRQNERYIHHICKKYLNLGIPYDDLVGCADLAFMKAIKQFNPNQSKWLTYYSRIISNEILMLNRKQRRWNDCISLQKVINEDGGGHMLTLEETLQSEDELYSKVLTKEVARALRKLPAIQQQVMLLTLDGNTQKSIGKRLGLSQSYISRVLQASRKQLKNKYIQGA